MTNMEKLANVVISINDGRQEPSKGHERIFALATGIVNHLENYLDDHMPAIVVLHKADRGQQTPWGRITDAAYRGILRGGASVVACDLMRIAQELDEEKPKHE